MPMYRKKPLVIEARLLTEDNAHDIANWSAGVVVEGTSDEGGGVTISTLEGDLHASLGDYVIRGTKGEFYPCKPDIFADIYEETGKMVGEGDVGDIDFGLTILEP